MYREFELPSNQSRRTIAIILALTLLLTIGLVRPATTNAATLATDAFGRVVATGWGSMDTGQAYFHPHGDTPFSVSGGVGKMNHTAIGELAARPPTFSAADVNIVAKFRAETAANSLPSSTTQFILYTRMEAEPYFRYYLRLVLSFVVDQPAPLLRVDRQAITYTEGIATVGLPTANNDPTEEWMVRFETVGTTIRGKAWLASASEPAAWQLTTTDNQVTNNGQIVVASFTDDVTPAMVIDVDNINVTGTPGTPDSTPPTIIARSPLPNATGVGLSTNVTAQFSEVVTGVSTASMAISNVSNFVNLPATVSYNPATRTATLDPSSPLVAGETYRVALSYRIKDPTGNSLAWTTWNFTTATSGTTYNPPAPVTFKKGTHTGYQFNASGAVTATKTFTLANNSGALTTKRQGIANQSGNWLAISSGIWAGYWLRESSALYVSATPVADPPGGNASFNPAISLTFLKGTHTGYQFNGAGAMTAQKTFTLGNNSSALTSARSTITNQSGKWFLVSSGVWAGYWVRSSDVVYLP